MECNPAVKKNEIHRLVNGPRKKSSCLKYPRPRKTNMVFIHLYVAITVKSMITKPPSVIHRGKILQV